MKKPLIIILITVLLDVIGLGIIFPILPFIVKGYGYSEFYVGIVYSVFALGMFFGGMIFGKMSDNIGRNRTLEFTIILNIIGYFLLATSSNLWLFIAARFIGGLGGSGFSVGQAYISDISTEKNRTKNMGLMGAIFGIGFIIGPVLGGILSNLGSGINFIGYFSAVASIVNLLLVFFLLPKVKIKKASVISESKFYVKNPAILILFTISFITAFGFSSMQSTFPLIMESRFYMGKKEIGYMFGFVGLIALLYQGGCIKYVKKYLKEYQMVIFGLLLLLIGFLIFSINKNYYLMFFLTAIFTIGHGTINPVISSIQSKLGSNHVGKILGINTSIISLGNILGPFLAGSLYLIWSGLSYIFASILFTIGLIIFFLNKKKYE